MKKLRMMMAMTVIVAMSAIAYISFADTGTNTQPGMPTFKDVPATHWAYDYIERMSALKGISGTGDGQFSPDEKMTNAQFLAIVERLFADELNIEASKLQPIAGQPWYQPYVNAAGRAKLYVGNKIREAGPEANLTRYDMAGVCDTVFRQIASDGGYHYVPKEFIPSELQLQTAQAKITDYATIPEFYREDVVRGFASGLMSGYSDGSFGGANGMTRAEGCAVICRLLEIKETHSVNWSGASEKLGGDAANYGAVGTVSDSPVTISVKTHTCPTNYWADAPADVKAVTDKDAYNAYVQSYKDRDLILSTKDTTYYNYAAYDSTPAGKKDPAGETVTAEKSRKVSNVVSASLRLGGGYGGLGPGSSGVVYANEQYTEVFTPALSDNKAVLDKVFASIFEKFTPDMTDSEKIKIMVQEVCNRIDYGLEPGIFFWEDSEGDKPFIGACGDYQGALADILAAAGYDVIQVDGSNHGWCEVYVPDLGKWLICDATGADTGNFDSFVLVEYEQDGSYGGGMRDGNPMTTKIIKTMIDAGRAA